MARLTVGVGHVLLEGQWCGAKRVMITMRMAAWVLPDFLRW
ncbi:MULTISPECIES: hypothetical protein [Burkholderia cepacia complex]|nr:hypothetical protein [Burkholderia metallica]